VRHRSPENIVAELRAARRRYGIRKVEFFDDNFTQDRLRLKALLALYHAEVGLPFRCLSHPLHLDEEVARVLREAGCYKVEIGIQSMDDHIRSQVLRRPETRADIERALEACDRVGLPYQVDHILAVPGEGEQEYAAAARFYLRFHPSRIGTYRLTYFPRTTLFEQSCATGLLDESQREDIMEGRAGLPHLAGALMDPSLDRRYRGWEALFTLLPLLPRAWGHWFARNGRVRLLARIPTLAVLSIDLVTFARSPDSSMRAYLRYYAYQCADFLERRAPSPLRKPLRWLRRTLAPPVPAAGPCP
jgi:radical SAM superfamily enzyme YgiQ (UPF0313 family)